jgi:putative phosphoesterase
MNDREDGLKQLDRALDRLLAGDEMPDGLEAEVEELVGVASEVKGLPRASFKARVLEELVASTAAAQIRMPFDVVKAMRIGIIADTHCKSDDGSDLPEQVLEAFRGVDLIIHCGDLGKLGVLDRLQTVAPVLAVRSPNDPHEQGSRLAESRRVIDAGGIRIGVTFALTDLGVAVEPGFRLRFPDEPLDQTLKRGFGDHVDVVAFATIHKDMIVHRGNVLVVNPGSPTAPAVRREGELGTVAVLETRDGHAAIEVIRLRK